MCYLKEAFAPEFLSNWVLAGIGAAAVIVAVITLFSIKDQATAARLNAQALIDAERAWVMAELSAYGDSLRTLVGEGYETGHGLYQSISVENVKLTLRNQGKTPAWIENVRAQVDIVDSTSVRNEPVLRGGTQGSMEPLGAGEERSRSLELVCDGRREGDQFLSIYVVITYRDIFGRSHETTLGYSVTSISNGQLLRQQALPHRNRNT